MGFYESINFLSNFQWVYRLGLLGAEIRAYLMSLLDSDWSMVSEG
jgi:hypothetical protein